MRIAAPLITSGAVVLAIGLGATSAFAATTLTVKISGGGTSNATASSATLKDGSFTISCTTKGSTPASTAILTAENATHKGSPPVGVGTFAMREFENCTGPLGALTITLTAGPYSFDADSATTGPDTDVIVDHVKISIAMTSCALTVTGSAPGYYDNATHTLHLTPSSPVKPLTAAKLTASSVTGCLGVVSQGSHPTYTAIYKLSTPTLMIRSTS